MELFNESELFQENKSLHEIVAKLEHSRNWLEERVETLENTMSATHFATNVINGEEVDESKKTAK